MSFETRIERLRQQSEGQSAYAVVANSLKKDREAVFAYFNQNRINHDLSEELIDTYELRPAELPTLVLPNHLKFVSGFSYVASHWYPLVRAVGSGLVVPGDEDFMNDHLTRMFPDGIVTTQSMIDALSTDATGATWLEERARFEFRQGNLELLGATKAIIGAKKMYEALTA